MPRAFACSSLRTLDPQKFDSGVSRSDMRRLCRLLRDDAHGVFLTKILTWTVEDAGPYNLRRALGETNFKMLSLVREK